MENLIECVPNFSEGQNQQTIAAIADAMGKVSGIRYVHTDSGKDAHRTVVTVFGTPEAVVESAYRGAMVAAQSIDMPTHRGVHPRIGATDVIPFVPWSGATFELCIELAERLAKRLAAELKLPVYLYGKAARRPYCRELVELRRGGYEGFAKKMRQELWHPDFGDAWNMKSGATAVGVRDVLIAFNITLATSEVAIARKIATALRKPGILQTMGWYMHEYGRAQVSTNILDYRQMSLETLFSSVEERAKQMGTTVTGSQIVGMVPTAALIAAGRGFSNGRESNHSKILRTAIDGLRLNDLAPFRPAERIIELALGERR